MTLTTWKGKTVIICGASAGLGRDFAIELAEQQVARMALVARSVDRLESLRAQLLADHADIDILCLAADLCAKEQLLQVARHLTQAWGQVDLLVQAVGQSDRGQLLELDQARLQELVNANVLSSLHAIQCFEPLLVPSQASATARGGTIVLIGSLASKFAPRFLGGYAIAKHGLAALAQQARLEMAERRIHVLLACPGPIARSDAGSRYEISTQQNLPDSVRQPGGGAKLRGLDSRRLVRAVLTAAANRVPEIIRPRTASLLVWLSAFSRRLGDILLRKNSS